MLLDLASLPTSVEPPPLDAATWQRQGAARALRLLQHLQYGWLPPAVPVTRIETILPEAPTADGLGLRSVLRLHCHLGERHWQGDLLVVRPAAATGPVPVLAGLNFKGIQTTIADEAIPVSPAWVAEPGPRGGQAGRWDFAQAMRAGVAVATMGMADLHPDTNDAAILDAAQGVNRLFGRVRHQDRGPHDWAAIAAWAWGLHRIVDALEAQSWADAGRIGVIGHSRLGKTSLLAAATDPRIALCVDNQSGTCGGSLSRKPGNDPAKESLAQIVARFPYWFCPALFPLTATPERLPVDQHFLLAAIAPRPLLQNYAIDDQWADPDGSFRCARLAEPAWASYGHAPALPATAPGPHTLVGDRLAWHLRPGKHGVTAEDWTLYLRFCARWWPITPR